MLDQTDKIVVKIMTEVGTGRQLIPIIRVMNKEQVEDLLEGAKQLQIPADEFELFYITNKEYLVLTRLGLISNRD